MNYFPALDFELTPGMVLVKRAKDKLNLLRSFLVVTTEVCAKHMQLKSFSVSCI